MFSWRWLVCFPNKHMKGLNFSPACLLLAFSPSFAGFLLATIVTLSDKQTRKGKLRLDPAELLKTDGSPESFHTKSFAYNFSASEPHQLSLFLMKQLEGFWCRVFSINYRPSENFLWTLLITTLTIGWSSDFSGNVFRFGENSIAEAERCWEAHDEV